MKALFRLSWFVAAMAVCGTVSLQAQDRRQWLLSVPEIGDLTLELNPPYENRQSGKLYWLFEDQQITWAEEGNSIRMYRNSWRKEEKPTLLFQLRRATDGSLTFDEAGIVDAQRLKWWKPMLWTPIDRHDEKRFRAFNYADEQRKRFTERGYLKPFPATYPSAFVETTALLFIDHTHELAPLLEYPKLSTTVIETIGRYALAQPKESEWSFLLPRIAAHPSCPKPSVEEFFARPDDPMTWRAAALNPNAPAEFRATYLQRIKEGKERIRALVARDSLAPREAWELALAPGEQMVLNEFARNKAAPPDLLARIATQSGGSAVELAGNPQTPAAILESLSASTDKQVLWALMRNTAASKAVVERALRTLATSKSQNERSTAALDKRLPLDLFPNLAADKSIHIRMCVANNLGTPVEILERLAFDPYRTVSEHAVYLLKEYHPERLAVLKDRLPDPDSLNPATGLVDEFMKAIERGDIEKVRTCLAQQDDLEERITPDFFVGSALRSRHFEALKGLIAEQVQQGGDTSRGTLVTNDALRKEHIAWLKSQGYLTEPWASRSVLKAVERGDVELVTALLEAGTPVESAEPTAAAPLIIAASRRNLPIVQLLLAKGADPKRKFRDLTAADVAAQVYFIAGLRLLDVEHKHQKFLDDFAGEFPATSKAPILGSWTNRKDGFSTVSFALDADGTGFLGASITAMPIAWKQESEKEFIIVPVTPEGIQRDKGIRLTYDSGQKTLSSSSFGERQTFYRADRDKE